MYLYLHLELVWGDIVRNSGVGLVMLCHATCWAVTPCWICSHQRGSGDGRFRFTCFEYMLHVVKESVSRFPCPR
jgi:hypothetical protein